MPDILFAIRRLESHNGIAVYLRRLGTYLSSKATPFDLMIGLLRRVAGTEKEMQELIGSARRVTIGEDVANTNPAHKGGWYFYALLILRCLGRIRNPIVVSTHSFDALMICAVMARVWKKVHVVHTLHLSPKPERVRRFKSKFGRIFFRQNRRVHFHATSAEIEKVLLSECGIEAGQVRKIVYGVDPEAFRPPSAKERKEFREQIGIEDSRFCIAIVGRVNEQKGHDFLLRALAKIPDAAQKYEVVVVGGGSPEWLEKIAKETGMETIVKSLGHADPIRALWAADLFVLPSRWEGFALASLEAMACGLPVIRTNTAGAIDQIEDGVNGFVVPIEDPERLPDLLAQKIAEIANSASVSSRMGEASRERALSMFNQDALLEITRQFMLATAKEANK